MKLIAGLLLGATLGSAAPQSLPRLAPDSFNKRALPQVSQTYPEKDEIVNMLTGTVPQ